MSRTILVIEDNEEERKIFSTYLEFVGVRLLQANNGAMGIEMARRHRPDMILMDLSMPVMTGWEAIAQLKTDPGTAEIPVAAITGHHLPAERLEEAGFCGYLEKPLAPYRVLEEVERCLGPLEAPNQRRENRARQRDRRTSLRRAVPGEGVAVRRRR
jgi:two-component system, cell cycle response regulator DivK